MTKYPRNALKSPYAKTQGVAILYITEEDFTALMYIRQDWKLAELIATKILLPQSEFIQEGRNNRFCCDQIDLFALKLQINCIEFSKYIGHVNNIELKL